MSDHPKLTEIEQRVLRALFDGVPGRDDGTSEVPDIAKMANCTPEEAQRALDRLLVLGLTAKSGPAVTLEEIDAAIKALDEKATCDTPVRVLMGSLLIGAADEVAITGTGLSPDDVRVVGDRLRANGVWDAGGVCEPADGTEFWLLANVAGGRMLRQFDRSKGEWMYSLTPETRAELEKKFGGMK